MLPNILMRRLRFLWFDESHLSHTKLYFQIGFNIFGHKSPSSCLNEKVTNFLQSENFIYGNPAFILLDHDQSRFTAAFGNIDERSSCQPHKSTFDLAAKQKWIKINQKIRRENFYLYRKSENLFSRLELFAGRQMIFPERLSEPFPILFLNFPNRKQFRFRRNRHSV